MLFSHFHPLLHFLVSCRSFYYGRPPPPPDVCHKLSTRRRSYFVSCRVERCAFMPELFSRACIQKRREGGHPPLHWMDWPFLFLSARPFCPACQKCRFTSSSIPFVLIRPFFFFTRKTIKPINPDVVVSLSAKTPTHLYIHSFSFIIYIYIQLRPAYYSFLSSFL